MRETSQRLLLRACGWLWLFVWAAVLAALLRLWATLGGLVEERTIWWARFTLLGAAPLGGYAGVYARDLAAWGRGRSHAKLLRLFWLPPAALTATGMLVATVAGAPDLARLLLGGFLGYWAGFDAAIGAWPAACGRPYRFLRDIPPEPERPWSPGADDFDRWA